MDTLNQCAVCGSRHSLERHHIIFRSHHVKDDEHNTIMLCPACHRGENGVHGKNGFYLDLELKLGLQSIYYSLGMKDDQVRSLMGGKLRSNDEYFD